MPSPELKPCPWCRHNRTLGTTTEYIDAGSPKRVKKFHVSCACGAMGPSAKTHSEAVAAWNRRAGEDEAK